MIARNNIAPTSPETVLIRGPLSRKQVGALLCLTEQRVGQIERQAVAKLISRLRSIGVHAAAQLFEIADEAIARTVPQPKPPKPPRPRHVKTTELVLNILQSAGHRMSTAELVRAVDRSPSTIVHAIAALCREGTINGLSWPKQYGLPAWPVISHRAEETPSSRPTCGPRRRARLRTGGAKARILDTLRKSERFITSADLAKGLGLPHRRAQAACRELAAAGLLIKGVSPGPRGYGLAEWAAYGHISQVDVSRLRRHPSGQWCINAKICGKHRVLYFGHDRAEAEQRMRLEFDETQNAR